MDRQHGKLSLTILSSIELNAVVEKKWSDH